MRIGPADQSQRAVYYASLSMAGLPSERGMRPLPKFMSPFLSLPRAYILASSGDGPFVWAAKQGAKGEQWLIEKLGSPVAHDRWRAIAALQRVGSDNCAGAIALLMKDEDARVREETVVALLAIGTSEALEFVRGEVSTASDDVQWLAGISGLYERGEPVDLDAARVTRAANLIRTEGDLDRGRLEAYLCALPAEQFETLIREEFEHAGQFRYKGLAKLAKQTSPVAVQLLRESLQDERFRNRVILHLDPIPLGLIEDVKQILPDLPPHYRATAERRLAESEARP